MAAESRIKQVIGDMVVQNVQLVEKIEALQAELEALRAKVESWKHDHIEPEPEN